MLSKILREQQKQTIEPLPWRRAGETATVPPRPAPPPTTAKAPAAIAMQRTDAGHFEDESALQQQIKDLQARLAQMEAAAERRIRETRESAYREGEAAGRNQAMAQMQSVLDKLAQSIREIAELRPKLRHEAETDVVKLAMAIAKKVLHRELVADPDALSGLIRVAMEKIRVHEIVRVRIHPQQHGPVQQAVGRFAMGAQVEITADTKLPLGGVVVETTRGEFDASVDVQLKEIERGLTDRLLHSK
jgi:flagellar assembly protein FliH